MCTYYNIRQNPWWSTLFFEFFDLPKLFDKSRLTSFILIDSQKKEKQVKVTPLAFDSLGVRSMATLVETDLRIMIDPGLDLAPSRYGLPPTKLEQEKAKELSARINHHARETDIFIVTHYHHDHYFPEADFYEGKVLLLKHPRRNINFNQRKRAKLFIGSFENRAKRIEYAESKEFTFSGTKITFSPAVPHGEILSKTGFVVMCSLSHAGEKLLFASDVQGPQVDHVVKWIVAEDPNILILSGYHTYLKQIIDPRVFEECNQNLIEILIRSNTKTIILDHHLTRDLEYREKIAATVERARAMGRQITTAAEYLGGEPELLEARRKEIHKAEANQESAGT
jgi:predicted metallo-beta-lactamase superfamily hydrolase